MRKLHFGLMTDWNYRLATRMCEETHRGIMLVAEEIHLSIKSGGRKSTFLTELIIKIGLERWLTS